MLQSELKTKLGQLYFIGLEGCELLSHEAKFIVENNIAGVTLFGRNVETPEQVHKLCTDLQNLRHQLPEKLPLFIAIDMEGGRVHRLSLPFTQWPALQNVGQLDSSTVAFNFARCMGLELQASGINLNFAPCVDIFSNPKNFLIEGRALSTDAAAVAKLIPPLLQGYNSANITNCVKHFPGHGDTLVDSHEELPVENTDLNLLRTRELIPFAKAFSHGADMTMTGHLLFKNIDAEFPATFSKKILGDLLRNEMGCENVIISDDLDMGALRKNFDLKDIPLLALKAGCNILLYCNEFDIPPQSLEIVLQALENKTLDAELIQSSYKRVLALKEKAFKNRAHIDPPPFSKAQEIIGCPEHKQLAQAIEAGENSKSLPYEFTEQV